MASSAAVRTVLCGKRGPIGASSVVVRARHLVTVLRLSRSVWPRHRSSLSTLGARLELAASFGRCRDDHLP